MIFTACQNERCEEFNLLNFDIVHEEKHFHYSSHYQKGIQIRKSLLTDTGENFQKWTRVFSTRR